MIRRRHFASYSNRSGEADRSCGRRCDFGKLDAVASATATISTDFRSMTTVPLSVMLALLLSVITMPCEARRPPLVEAFFQGHCSSLSPCHQICVDVIGGGFECSCETGYQLQPNGFACFPLLPSDSQNELVDQSDFVDLDHATNSEWNVTQQMLADDYDAILPLSRPHPVTAHVVESTSTPPITLTQRQRDRKTPGTDRRRSAGDVEHHEWFQYINDDTEIDHWEQNDQPMEFNPAGNNDDEEEDEDDDGVENGSDDDENEVTNNHDKGKGGDVNDNENVVGGRKRVIRKRSKGLKWTDLGKSTKSVGNSATHRGHEDGLRHSKSKHSKVVNFDEDDDDDDEDAEEDYDMDSSSTSPCDRLHCSGSAQCVVDSKEQRPTARCRCPLGTTGFYCERDTVVKYPKFSGTGYMAFPVLRGSHERFTMVVEFRPDIDEGLILFSADNSDVQFDFFSLTLLNGRLEFRFDCGSGMALIRTPNQVEVSKWNTVRIDRIKWNGSIKLNDGTKTHGRSKGEFTGINFHEDFYLGGYVNYTKISERTAVSNGFVGCIRRLEVNDNVYDMRKGEFIGDALRGFDVDECSTDVCTSMQCLNGGSCEAGGADIGVCLCPLGVTGDRCERRVDIRVPMFNGTSFLQFIGLQRTVLSFTEFEIIVKPTSKDGLIFYNGFSKNKTGDFISLALKNGYVEYRFDLGTGPAYLRSTHTISMNEWHVIWFWRTGRKGYLKVDKQQSVEGMSSGAFTQLTLILDLFIGGHRNFDEVAKAASVSSSFSGCIQKVVVNKRPMKLLEEALTGVNVDSCDHPCSGQPCLNGGRCDPIKDTYTCNCPLGYINTNCEEVVSEAITVPSFTGDSYLLYVDPYMMERTRGKQVDIQMWVKPRGPDGLLFWVSEDEVTPTPYSDYLAIGLHDGYVQFGYNLGSGEVLIVGNKTRINDTRWHSIRVHRHERSGYLEVDGSGKIPGTSPGTMKHLTTNGTVFIGGMDNIVLGTLHKYSSGFVGCIANVTMATYVVDLMIDADDGSRNVGQCSMPDHRWNH